MPNQFTATTKIMPPQQNQSLANALMGQLGALGALGSLAGGASKDLGLKNPNEMYVGMLNSRTVEDDIIKRFSLTQAFHTKRLSDARKALDKRSDIALGKDGMITISYEDKDKDRAAAVANAYVDELKLLMQRLAITEASQRRLFFEQQLEESKDKLADAEVALQLTQQKTGLIDLSSQARAVIQSIATLRGEIAAKEVELQAMKAYATPENPKVIMAEQQLAAWRDQLAKAETKQGSLGAGNVEIPTSRVPEVGVEYIRRVRDVKYYETIFELLARQYEAAKLDEAKNSGLVQVVDTAIVPDRKSFPPRTLIVVISTMLGLLCGVVFALLKEAYGRLQHDSIQGHKIARIESLLLSRSRSLNVSR
jgi:uncharacterized protein involved in exopolysaccharide biosynthesis